MNNVLGCALLHAVLVWLTCSGRLIPKDYNHACLEPHDENETITCYEYGSALFGVMLREDLRGYGIIASPKNACSEVKPINPNWKDVGFLLIDDYGCSRGYKALMAQNGGYDAAIIINTHSDRIITMDSDKYGRQVDSIIAIYVGKSAGNLFISDVGDGTSTKDAIIITPQEYPYLMNLEFYVIPFAVIVGICFVLMGMFMISRYYRSYLEKRRNRLTPTNLRKIPTKKFKKGDEYYDVCAICLDDYKEGDRLRILPCDHAYHCKCVDPWLTEGKKTCPVCKRPVETGKKKKTRGRQEPEQEENISDREPTDREPTETTPLIQPPGPSSSTNALLV